MAVADKKAARRSRVLTNLVLTICAITAMIPFFLVLINSFKPHFDIVANPLSLPKSLSLENYAYAWTDSKIGGGFKNSIILTGCTVVLTLISATMAGYALAMGKVKGSKVFMTYFMMIMTVPIQLFLFPLYFAMSALNLVGTAMPISFILAARNLPFAIFLMRTFFVAVPRELEEAARIDGANTRQVLQHVMAPLVSPGLLTVSVIVALGSWNEYLVTSTFLQGNENYTVTLLLRNMQGQYGSHIGGLMAGTMITILPILAFFMLTQKYFIDGLVSGSVKG